MQPDEVNEVFTYLDVMGSAESTASVDLQLTDRKCLTVRAGGPGIHSRPTVGPYQGYEVIFDHDPAPYWSRYSDDGGLLYGFVPKLLICQHIITHLGIDCTVYETVNQPAVSISVTLDLRNRYEVMIWKAIEEIKRAALANRLRPTQE